MVSRAGRAPRRAVAGRFWIPSSSAIRRSSRAPKRFESRDEDPAIGEEFQDLQIVDRLDSSLEELHRLARRRLDRGEPAGELGRPQQARNGARPERRRYFGQAAIGGDSLGDLSQIARNDGEIIEQRRLVRKTDKQCPHSLGGGI